MRKLYEKLARSSPTLIAGQVYCPACGRTLTVSSAHCLATGWPMCCGETMQLDIREHPKNCDR